MPALDPVARSAALSGRGAPPPTTSPRSPAVFVGLVVLLSVPFWLVGAATGGQLGPALPIAALMALCPIVAASILEWRRAGAGALWSLWRRGLDPRRLQPAGWYLPALFLAPTLTFLADGFGSLFGGTLQPPVVSSIPFLAALIGFAVAAYCEETGWTGHATDPLQRRWSALATGLALGLVAALWHVIPLIQAHHAPAWIAGQLVQSASSRVLIVWLYNNTRRSVLAAILFHLTSNVAYVLVPVAGSGYDARIVGPVFAVAAALVVVTWGPRTLARDRRGRQWPEPVGSG